MRAAAEEGSGDTLARCYLFIIAYTPMICRRRRHVDAQLLTSLP